MKIPKELQGIAALAILCTGIFIYNNLALIAILILSILGLVLFFWGLAKYLNDGYWDSQFEKQFGIVLMIISLIPGYFSGYITYSYDESNKYLQEKSLGGLLEIGKFALSGKRFNAKNVFRAIENNATESMREEMAKDVMQNVSKQSRVPIIESNATIQSGVLRLNPVIK